MRAAGGVSAWHGGRPTKLSNVDCGTTRRDRELANYIDEIAVLNVALAADGRQPVQFFDAMEVVKSGEERAVIRGSKEQVRPTNPCLYSPGLASVISNMCTIL